MKADMRLLSFDPRKNKKKKGEERRDVLLFRCLEEVPNDLAVTHFSLCVFSFPSISKAHRGPVICLYPCVFALHPSSIFVNWS